MIAIIRIKGMIGLPKAVQETLHRMLLRRKYALVVLKETEELNKKLKKIRNYVAYGKIDDKTLKDLVEKRAQLINKEDKLDVSKVLAGIGEKKAEDLGIKGFFRLHPPRKGIDAKKHFGVNKGVLGDNKEKINELIWRML
jgi:large subunit ribosomal protein L30